MREEYSIPDLEIIEFNIEDVITMSGGDYVDDPFGNEGENDGW